MFSVVGTIRPLDLELVFEPKADANGESPAVATATRIEEAIEALGHGKFHWILLAVTGTSLLALVTELINIGFVANAAACDLPATVTQRGLLLSAAFAGVVLSSHAWGYATDRYGRRCALRTAAASAACCSLLSAFAPNIAALIAGRLATGVCVSGIQSAALVYLGEFHGLRTRARAVTQAAMCMVVALWFMAAVAWLVLPLPVRWSLFDGAVVVSAWRLDVCACAAVLVAVVVALRWLPESPQYLLARGRQAEALEALRRAYRVNHGRMAVYAVQRLQPLPEEDDAEHQSNATCLSAIWCQTRPILVRPLLWSTVLMGYLSFVLFMIAHGMNMWLPAVFSALVAAADTTKSTMSLCETLRQHQQNQVKAYSNASDGRALCTASATGSASESTVLLLVYTAGCVLIFFVVSLMLRRCGLRRILVVWFAVSAATACGCVHLSVMSTLGARTVLVTAIIAFLSCGNCGCIVGAMAQDLFPVRVRAMALCVIFALGRLGSVVGSNVLGVMLFGGGASGCAAVFYGSGVLLVSCAVLVGWCLPRTSAEALDDDEVGRSSGKERQVRTE